GERGGQPPHPGPDPGLPHPARHPRQGRRRRAHPGRDPLAAVRDDRGPGLPGPHRPDHPPGGGAGARGARGSGRVRRRRRAPAAARPARPRPLGPGPGRPGRDPGRRQPAVVLAGAVAMSSIAPDICADFLVEAGDQLGEQMVALERAPGDRECLNAVFRGFHTIKGGAGFLDFDPMVAVCHAVEDRLNAARDGSAPLDPEAFDGVQQGIDLLVDMLASISAGAPPQPAPQALLDALRAGAAGTAPAPARRGAPAGLRAAAAGPAPAPAAAAGDDDSIDDLDFEALLDSLHGVGGVPGAQPAAAPAPAPVPASAPAPTPAPAPPPRPPAPAGGSAPKAHEPADVTVRVDVRRLDAMVNLVGELVLARNRLKTIRPRLRDDELDRAVAALDVATSRLQGAVMTARMQPVGRVFARFPKLAR